MQTSLSSWLGGKPKPTISRPSHSDAQPTPAPPPLPTTIAPPPPPSASLAARPHHSTTLTTDPIPTSHPQITLQRADPFLIKQFKRLNSTLLPVAYSASFYNEILTDDLTATIALLAVWTDIPSTADAPAQTRGGDTRKVIAGIRCRILHPPNSETSSSIRATEAYLATSFFAPATAPARASRAPAAPLALLDGPVPVAPMLYLSTVTVAPAYRLLGLATQLLDVVVARARELYAVRAVGAHVWVANAGGIEWYAKRGFEEVQREEGYYPRLERGAALVVVKVL